MPVIQFELETALSPEAVLKALTDFSPHRAEVWANIDEQHLKVNGRGDGWADVTEGNGLAGGIWERSRYEWGADAGRVKVTTLDSNVWGSGSGWDYRLTPTASGGTSIRVRAVREPNSAKGVLIGAMLRVAGARRLRSDMRRVLEGLER